MATAQLEIEGIPHSEPKNTAMELIDATIAKGVSAADLATLLDVKLKFEAAENKRRFDHALERFRANPPDINKTKHVSFPNKDGKLTEYDHAELDKSNEIVTAALLAVGIYHRWKLGDAGGRTTVTLELRGFGHAEEMGTISGPPDTSGGKNSIQAIGSTTTYLQRYVLLASLGLVAEGMDDDGKTEGMPEQAILEYCQAIKDSHSLEDAKRHFNSGWEKSKKVNDNAAGGRLMRVWEEKKKEVARAGQR
jgi:hypothetical protein